MSNAPGRLREMILPCLCVLAALTSIYTLLNHRQAVQDAALVGQNSVGADAQEAQGVTDVQVLGELAVTLAGWLEKGSGTLDIAPKAQLLASFVARVNDDPTRLNNDFWQSYSRRLSELEQHVRDNEINTPEARALVVQMRREYATLRESSQQAALRKTNPAGPIASTTSELTPSSDPVRRSDVSLGRLQPWLTIAAVLGALAALLSVFEVVRKMRQRLADQHHENLERERLQRIGHSSGSQQNNDQLAILKLLDEMTPLAGGDLSVTATVSEAMTGALADAFNYSVLELRRLVQEISNSTEQINDAIATSRAATRKIASAGSVQSREVLRSTNYLSAMSDAMSQLSVHSTQSAEMAEATVEQTQQARHAAQSSLQALSSIKSHADATAQSMQRLVKSTELIQSRVVEIKAVAERTDLLALNTTIHAVANSDISNTDQYARLSDEVSALADILGGASRDIIHCVETIQIDANDTLASMQQTQKELQTGYARVDEVRSAFDSIDGICRQLQTQVTDMAEKALKQTGVVKKLSANMSVINNLTHDTSADLHESSKQVDSLHQLSERLRRSVAGFTLPRQDRVGKSRKNRTPETSK